MKDIEHFADQKREELLKERGSITDILLDAVFRGEPVDMEKVRIMDVPVSDIEDFFIQQASQESVLPELLSTIIKQGAELGLREGFYTHPEIEKLAKNVFFKEAIPTGNISYCKDLIQTFKLQISPEEFDEGVKSLDVSVFGEMISEARGLI